MDRFEDFWVNVWNSLHFSPAWLFVAAVGGLGIALTILLFFMLTQEILAAGRSDPRALRVIDSAELVRIQPEGLDSRLCVADIPLPRSPLPAEFDFLNGVMLAESPESGEFATPPVRRPPSRRVPSAAPELDSVSVVEPVANRTSAPQVDLGEPDLQVAVDVWRQPAVPQLAAGKAQVLNNRSQFAALQNSVRPNLSTDRLVLEDSSRWTWHQQSLPTVDSPQVYAGDRATPAGQPDESAWNDVAAWPGKADIALHVELFAPEVAGIHQRRKSKIVIRNDGSEAIRRVELQEPVRPLEFVTNAEPSANLQEGILYREFRRLSPGGEKTAELEWFTNIDGQRHHEARVLAEAYVAATVEVKREIPLVAEEPADRIPAEPVETVPDPVEPTPEPVIRRPPSRRPVTPVEEPSVEPTPRPEPMPEPAPVPASAPAAAQPEPVTSALACRVVTKDRITVDDVAEFDIEVRNTGTVQLSGVRVLADLPENLHHKHGRQLELTVGDLSAGEVQHAVLRVVGEKPGHSRARIQAIADEVRSDHARPTLSVFPSLPLKNPAREVPKTDSPCPCQAQLLLFSSPF